MIFGVGTDLLELSRIQETYDRFGDHFVNRLLMQEEREQFARNKWPVRFLAMRFAAKEAAAKAMGLGFRNGLHLRQIGVIHDVYGKPKLEFSGYAAEFMQQQGIAVAHISLSDEKDLAIAFVTLEIK